MSEPDRYSDEGPIHRVNIEYDLAVGRFEVTQGQWKSVMGNNPSRFKDCGDTCPVENVGWEDAQEYLRRLSMRGGKKYRLLSEAEWEYAARAGSATPLHTGATITTDQANFDGSFPYNNGVKGIYREKPIPVGSFDPNGFGIYDMHGNVWEWVQDYYHEGFVGAPVDGSSWESGGDGHRRIMRGGAWNTYSKFLRSANRNGSSPDERGGGSGFRIARVL